MLSPQQAEELTRTAHWPDGCFGVHSGTGTHLPAERLQQEGPRRVRQPAVRGWGRWAPIAAMGETRRHGAGRLAPAARHTAPALAAATRGRRATCGIRSHGERGAETEADGERGAPVGVGEDHDQRPLGCRRLEQVVEVGGCCGRTRRAWEWIFFNKSQVLNEPCECAGVPRNVFVSGSVVNCVGEMICTPGVMRREACARDVRVRVCGGVRE